MRCELRKGQASVYLQYVDGSGDAICAEAFEACLESEALVIRFRLRPVDDNQRIDERRLHTDELSQVQISDDYIIDKLQQLLRQPYVVASELRVEIVSLGRSLRYVVSSGATGLGMLPLVVSRVAS